MLSKNLIMQFARLFQGRIDAYGDGGANPRAVRQPVTTDVFSGHLTGLLPIGIYPIRDDGTVMWGCVDIDFDDIDLAFELAEEISEFSHGSNQPWVERSRSKGYHVWVFFRDPVPAIDVRAGLLHCCDKIGYSPKEVNPKQGCLEEGQLGNFVRLPYPATQSDTDRQKVLISRGRGHLRGKIETLTFEKFITYATALLEPACVTWAQAGANHVPPVKRDHDTIITELPAVDAAVVKALIDRLPKMVRTIVIDGPKVGHDRSNSLVRLAHIMAESGLDVATAALALTIADARWGKFHTRADGERQILAILAIAYGEDLR